MEKYFYYAGDKLFSDMLYEFFSSYLQLVERDNSKFTNCQKTFGSHHA